jgi:uncharacterized protein (DUF1330 family)
MREPLRLFRSATVFIAAGIGTSLLPAQSDAQPENHPAFVIVERLATTAPESVQQEYAKLARDILPKYGARYLARSQHNTLLEGDGTAPCCIAVLQFPSLDAAQHWYNSPENQAAAKVRRSGGTFRLVAIEGLPDQK